MYSLEQRSTKCFCKDEMKSTLAFGIQLQLLDSEVTEQKQSYEYLCTNKTLLKNNDGTRDSASRGHSALTMVLNVLRRLKQKASATKRAEGRPSSWPPRLSKFLTVLFNISSWRSCFHVFHSPWVFRNPEDKFALCRFLRTSVILTSSFLNCSMPHSTVQSALTSLKCKQPCDLRVKVKIKLIFY